METYSCITINLTPENIGLNSPANSLVMKEPLSGCQVFFNPFQDVKNWSFYCSTVYGSPPSASSTQSNWPMMWPLHLCTLSEKLSLSLQHLIFERHFLRQHSSSSGSVKNWHLLKVTKKVLGYVLMPFMCKYDNTFKRKCSKWVMTNSLIATV